MCGINGLIGFQGQESLISGMNDALRHRGPDAEGQWHGGRISLGHRRLSIIDLSREANQPFVKDGLVVVYNGEIYNFPELKSELASQGVYFKTNSDTEVLLEMFRRYRQESFALLRGMFSFCIHDVKNNELFLARDFFGIKPLYYFQDKERLAFSSEIKALIGLPGLQRRMNPKALVSSLNLLWIYGDDSVFLDIKKVPPAHYLHVRLDNGTPRCSLKRYWKLVPEKKDLPEKKLTEQLRCLLEESIKKHLISDVPVGTFLSGGLDSSLISVIAGRTNIGLSTFTVSISERDKKAERMPADNLYARYVAGRYGFRHTDIPVSPSIVADLERMVSFLDEPIADPAALNTYLICGLARERGIKVLLSGMGADELFAGYRRQYATLLAQRFNSLPAFFKGPLAYAEGILPVKFAGTGLRTVRWLKRFLSLTGIPIEDAYLRSYSYYDREQLSSLLRHQLDPEIEGMYREHRELFYQAQGLDAINRMCYTDIRMFMEGLNLTYTDRASMATSVEVRVPFIDRTVVEFAMGLAGRYKIRGSSTKYLLKKAAAAYLPEKITLRPKASFGMPLRSWISAELRDKVDELLSEEAVRKRGILDYPQVRRMIENDRRGLEDNAFQIFQLLVLETWMRKNIDG